MEGAQPHRADERPRPPHRRLRRPENTRPTLCLHEQTAKETRRRRPLHPECKGTDYSIILFVGSSPLERRESQLSWR
jgi:hypothetical protein